MSTNHVEIFDGKGRVAWGGHFADIDGALAIVGWSDLDEDSHVLAERRQRASPGVWSQADVVTDKS